MKKQIKNTTLNRIFNKEKVNANIQRKHECERLMVLEPDFIDRIGSVEYDEGDRDSAKVTGIKSLVELLAIHKEAWKQGFRNQNIGPCEYGMFRTKDISNMQPHEVFLGNIYGLYTKSIPFWEDERFNTKSGGGWPIYDYLTVYQIVLNQYKSILSSNIKAIANQAKQDLDELFSLGYGFGKLMRGNIICVPSFILIKKTGTNTCFFYILRYRSEGQSNKLFIEQL